MPFLFIWPYFLLRDIVCNLHLNEKLAYREMWIKNHFKLKKDHDERNPLENCISIVHKSAWFGHKMWRIFLGFSLIKSVNCKRAQANETAIPLQYGWIISQQKGVNIRWHDGCHKTISINKSFVVNSCPVCTLLSRIVVSLCIIRSDPFVFNAMSHKC